MNEEFSRLLSATSAYCAEGPLEIRSADNGTSAPRRYNDTTSWDPYVAEIADADTYLRRKFRQDVTDRATGLDIDGIRGLVDGILAEGKASNEPWRITKAKCFAVQAERMAIDVSPLDWFPAVSIWDRWNRPICDVYWNRAKEINADLVPPEFYKAWNDGNRAGDWTIWQDFDHSVPDWRVVLKLGFPGLRKRLETYAKPGDPFYDGLFIAADAVLHCIDRMIAQGEKRIDETRRRMTADAHGIERLEKETACLRRLRDGKPETAYDLLMFLFLYFIFSEHLDGVQCRSLTEIDVFVTPYYDADIAAGRTTEAEFREQLKHWLWQWGSISNYWNQPIGLGGTKADGTSEYNHVTGIILDVIDEYGQTTPKFLAKVAPGTPEWAMDRMMDLARRHRSIAFIGEEPCRAAARKWKNATDEECRTMVVTGCYEFALRDGANGSCASHVNLLKPIETMLRLASATGEDRFGTMEAFKAEYLRRVSDVTACCRKIAEWTEKALSTVNPANMMTLSTEHALRVHKDGYADGSPRGNDSGLLMIGLGSAVDSLLAIDEIVYEMKLMTLPELGDLMAANWEGHEDLRLRMQRSARKWGNDVPAANALGREITSAFTSQINGLPNARGGIFVASGHSARQFIELGAKTGATPDGRKAGEEMSKNLSPSMGSDTAGTTSLVMTFANAGITTCDLPGDFPLDVMMHPSVCAGDDGLAAMKAVVRLFHAKGGGVVQFTVFSAEELKDAQAHPEKYENLQVRVCGWNVRWNDICRPEQDSYIRRAENIAH